MAACAGLLLTVLGGEWSSSKPKKEEDSCAKEDMKEEADDAIMDMDEVENLDHRNIDVQDKETGSLDKNVDIEIDGNENMKSTGDKDACDINGNMIRDDHDKIRDDHGKIRDDHDQTRDDHDQIRDDHDQTRDDHDQTRVDHDKTRDDHDQTRDDHDQTRDDHDQIRDDLDKIRDDHGQTRDDPDKIRDHNDKISSDYDNDIWDNDVKEETEMIMVASKDKEVKPTANKNEENEKSQGGTQVLDKLNEKKDEAIQEKKQCEEIEEKNKTCTKAKETKGDSEAWDNRDKKDKCTEEKDEEKHIESKNAHVNWDHLDEKCEEDVFWALLSLMERHKYLVGYFSAHMAR